MTKHTDQYGIPVGYQLPPEKAEDRFKRTHPVVGLSKAFLKVIFILSFVFIGAFAATVVLNYYPLIGIIASIILVVSYLTYSIYDTEYR